MIGVRKPAAPPILAKEGVAASAQHCADHDADPAAYASGASQFDFDSSIYGHKSVKSASRHLRHDKCEFCESDMMHTGYGDVEHFRPKGAWKQHEGSPLQYPGYFWLSYSWDNLFLSCTLCNQRYKQNLFPLRVQKHGEVRPARSVESIPTADRAVGRTREAHYLRGRNGRASWAHPKGKGND